MKNTFNREGHRLFVTVTAKCRIKEQFNQKWKNSVSIWVTGVACLGKCG